MNTFSKDDADILIRKLKNSRTTSSDCYSCSPCIEDPNGHSVAWVGSFVYRYGTTGYQVFLREHYLDHEGCEFVNEPATCHIDNVIGVVAAEPFLYLVQYHTERMDAKPAEIVPFDDELSESFKAAVGWEEGPPLYRSAINYECVCDCMGINLYIPVEGREEMAEYLWLSVTFATQQGAKHYVATLPNRLTATQAVQQFGFINMGLV